MQQKRAALSAGTRPIDRTTTVMRLQDLPILDRFEGDGFMIVYLGPQNMHEGEAMLELTGGASYKGSLVVGGFRTEMTLSRRC